MRDQRLRSAVREDKRLFEAHGYGAAAEGKARLMRLSQEKQIVYCPGLFSMLRTQLRYMSLWEYGVHAGSLLLVFSLMGYVQKKELLGVQELFVMAAVWIILATACFVGALELSAVNHMGELASACYLNLGQIVSLRLILGAACQLFALTGFGLFMRGERGTEQAPMGVYLLLVWMVANAVYFFIFASVRGRGQFFVLMTAALLLSVLACFVSLMADVLFLLSIGACSVIFLLCALLLGGELAYVFHGIKKGEILCFD